MFTSPTLRVGSMNTIHIILAVIPQILPQSVQPVYPRKMPRTLLSLRTTGNAWQSDRHPRKAHSRITTASVAPPPTRNPLPRSGSWAALMASAHDTYRRERTMTTDERVGEELNRLRHDGANTLQGDALTVDALRQLNRSQHDAETEYADTRLEGAEEEMVPSFGYAVAELAKSLEDARKGMKKAVKEAEDLRRENLELKVMKTEKEALQMRLDQYDGYVSPEVHARLKKGWEEWADAAEQKIERLEARLESSNEEHQQLQSEVEQKNNIIARLEERVKGWTNPHERKVLDATIEMLRNRLSDLEEDKENHATYENNIARITSSPRNAAKPALGRIQTVR